MPSPSRRPTPIRRTTRHNRRVHPITTALRLGVLMALALATASARAEPPFEGRYQGSGEGRLDLQVFEFGDGSGSHFVVAGTEIPEQCTGELRGLAKPAGPGALVLTRKDRGLDDTCTLTLRFGPDRRRVRMEERGCGDFHGTSCAFDGALTRR